MDKDKKRYINEIWEEANSMSNQNALFEIITSMEKEDYRRFSYLGIFKNKTRTILLILLISAVGAMLWCMMTAKYTLPGFLLAFAVLVMTSFAAISLKVEYKAMNRQGLVSAGLKGNRQYLNFFENYLTASEDISKDSSKIKYENLYEVLETADYYIVYASAGRASMIRKKDVEEEDRDGFREFLRSKLGTRYKEALNR